jgi:hypothetical protein
LPSYSPQQATQGPAYSNKAAVAKVLTQVLGGMDMRSAEQDERNLAQKRTADRQSEIDRIFSTLNPPSNLPTKDDDGNPMPAVGPSKEQAGRMALARMLAGSSNPAMAQAGLSLAMKGPEAPIIKESDGKIFVLSPDGGKLLNQYGGGKVAPPNVSDVTPESLKKYQETGDASVLVPRIKQQAVDTGGGTTFVNPENPPQGGIPKTMSPAEVATDQRDRARMGFEGINLPPSGAMDHGATATQIPPGVQAARDDGRMKILLDEQARLKGLGQTDPALEREIQLVSGQASKRAHPESGRQLPNRPQKVFRKAGSITRTLSMRGCNRAWICRCGSTNPGRRFRSSRPAWARRRGLAWLARLRLWACRIRWCRRSTTATWLRSRSS